MTAGENTLLQRILEQGAEARANIRLLLDDREAAAQSRREIYQGIAKLDTTVAGLGQRVARIEPLVDQHEASHNKAAGVVWAARSAWAVAGAGVLAGCGWLARKLGIA